MHQAGLLKAIKHFGTQIALAKAIGVSQRVVSWWLNDKKEIPYDKVLTISYLTNGSVSLAELAPNQKKLNTMLLQFPFLSDAIKNTAISQSLKSTGRNFQMNRIRTVKPQLFKHDELYDAEQIYQLPLRLAFIGLFTCCDRDGRFKWKPKPLKSDILPYDVSVQPTPSFQNKIHHACYCSLKLTEGEQNEIKHANKFL
ncbi:MAG: Cro/CI family transcriptional regulator [Gammaproteobacteria bacterium]